MGASRDGTSWGARLVAEARAHFWPRGGGRRGRRRGAAAVDVRAAILDSWRRCQDWNVSATGSRCGTSAARTWTPH